VHSVQFTLGETKLHWLQLGIREQSATQEELIRMCKEMHEEQCVREVQIAHYQGQLSQVFEFVRYLESTQLVQR
jgi:hypothetical protein